MRYLEKSEIILILHKGKQVEMFIGEKMVEGHKALEWIEIRFGKEKYELFYHLVFNDSDEGVDSVYDYSYVEPDELYGKLILSSKEISNIYNFVEDKFEIEKSNYLSFGFLDAEIKKKL